MSEPTYKREAFYARRLAKYYDASIEAVVPLYGLFQAQAVKLVVEHARTLDRPPLILDVGIGSGAETIGILRAIPEARIVGVDFAEEMKKEFYRKLFAEFGENPEEKNSVEWCAEDFSNDGFPTCRPVQEKKAFDIVISGFTIHHFPPDEKSKAFRKSYELLADNGLFINLDLANFASQAVQDIATRLDTAWISSNFEQPNAGALAGVLIPGLLSIDKIPAEYRAELAKRWIEHHAAENCLDSVEAQAAMLSEVGFREIECPLRFWQVALIRARK